MIQKQAQKIEVGLHEGRPGFTVEYTDGERAHFVFHRGIAKSLADALIKIVNELDYMDRQMAPHAPADGVGIRDGAQVRLSPPSLGITATDDGNVTD
jgi:hypothetical protein